MQSPHIADQLVYLSLHMHDENISYFVQIYSFGIYHRQSVTKCPFLYSTFQSQEITPISQIKDYIAPTT